MSAAQGDVDKVVAQEPVAADEKTALMLGGTARARVPCNDIHREYEGRWGSTRHPRSGLLATAVALPFEDELVGAVDEAVHRSLGEEGIRHGRQPLRRLTVGHRDDGAAAVPLDHNLVDVTGLDGVQRMDRKVVEDEHVYRDQPAHLRLV